MVVRAVTAFVHVHLTEQLHSAEVRPRAHAAASTDAQPLLKARLRNREACASGAFAGTGPPDPMIATATPHRPSCPASPLVAGAGPPTYGDGVAITDPGDRRPYRKGRARWGDVQLQHRAPRPVAVP